LLFHKEFQLWDEVFEWTQKGYLNCFPQMKKKKKEKTYQARPNGLVKETIASIETYNFVIVWSNCLTCLIFSHMKCFYHKNNNWKTKKKVCFFLQLGRGTVLIDISLIPRAFWPSLCFAVQNYCFWWILSTCHCKFTSRGCCHL
jgi:hypothetical protein